MAGNEPTQCDGCSNYLPIDDLIPVRSKQGKQLHLCENCFETTGTFCGEKKEGKRWGIKLFRVGDHKAVSMKDAIGKWEEAVSDFLNEHEVKEIKFAGSIVLAPNQTSRMVEGGGLVGELELVPAESIWVLVIFRQ